MAYHEAQLDALGDATRRAILARLLAGPQPVGSLAAGLPVSRPAVSQHLSVLKAANLVTDQAEGTRRLYAINAEAFRTLRDYFDRFWTIALDDFKKKVEQDHDARPSRRRSQIRHRKGKPGARL